MIVTIEANQGCNVMLTFYIDRKKTGPSDSLSTIAITHRQRLLSNFHNPTVTIQSDFGIYTKRTRQTCHYNQTISLCGLTERRRLKRFTIQN
mmetsp:Transcript_6138/g.15183  ORF Transcript_6138/g.15183 Transcript_6138/m.15183 type:complete len:92 (-) Transcript_6138:1916-2191(-)